MEDQEIQQAVLNLVNKGYSDHDTLKYCDDMYSATPEEGDLASDYLDECLEIGTAEYLDKYDLI